MLAKPDALSQRHDHAEIPNKAQIMITVERFQGFKAKTSLNVILAIQEAHEDESLETLTQQPRIKHMLPASVQNQFVRYTWEEGLLRYERKTRKTSAYVYCCNITTRLLRDTKDMPEPSNSCRTDTIGQNEDASQLICRIMWIMSTE